MSALDYPILMVHGMGFRDRKCFCYWGRIPEMLKKMGFRVYFANQDSNASIETNGEFINTRIDEILSESGAEKVHIIAHSKGGLDSRYAISTLKAGCKVASLTTMSTPHNGSRTVDRLLCFPKGLLRFFCFFVDLWFRIIGDKKPDTYAAVNSFKTESARIFNENNPDCEGVFYQSYGFVMKNPFSDMFMFITSFVVGLFEGENDGLLSPENVKWTNFRGIYRGVGRRGISHCDEVDMRRRRLSAKAGDGVSDILDVYREAADHLFLRFGK